ncbi:MAG TPA: hypothetical protein VEA59_00475 [Patescibacteria group bacterium]|nr:hypothetical protein [Patescibacteria group bacterium]
MKTASLIKIQVALYGTSALLAGLQYYLVRSTLLAGGDFETVLHYNALFGADILGNISQLYWLPVSAGLVLVVNALTGFGIRNISKVLPHILATVSLFFSIISCIALVLLLNIVQ